MYMFPLGKVVATRNAVSSIDNIDITIALKRHSSGDWGELCKEDKMLNDEALLTQQRLLSSYMSSTGTKFWIITEADRSITTVLLPEDY